MGGDGDPVAARQLLAEVHRRLRQEYGLPVQESRSDPTEELVRTILSQNTNDTNRDRAFAALRRRFPTWADVVRAPVSEVAEAIRPGGLADTKAPRIQAALAEAERAAGDHDLSFVCRLSPAEASRWLTALPGVGPKTAACVLLFSCGRPVMPVDTHILRLSGRLGLLPPRAGAEAAHHILGAAVPEADVYPLHINLIRHGRRVCKAQRPRCHECVLRDVCPYPG